MNIYICIYIIFTNSYTEKTHVPTTQIKKNTARTSEAPPLNPGTHPPF